MSRRVRSQFRYGLVVASFVVLAWSAALAQAPTPGEPPKPDRARELLEQCRATLAQAKSASATVTQTVTMRGPLMRNEQSSRHEFAFQRPNRVALELKEGMMGQTMVCDGEHLYNLMSMMNAYTKTEAPPTVEEALTGAEAQMGMGGGSIALAAPLLFGESPDGGEMGEIVKTHYKGTDRESGADAHHMVLTFQPDLQHMMGMGDDEEDEDEDEEDPDDEDDPEDEDAPEDDDDEARGASVTGKSTDALVLELHMWVDQGEQPLVRQLRLDVTPMMKKMAQEMEDQVPPQMRETSYEMTVTFSDWKVNPELPAERFAFTPPADAKEVGSMMEAFGGEEDQEASNPLLGKPAPDFELKNLQEQTVTLAQHKGQQIVVLDFWATWCGPCVQALPKLTQVTDGLRDQGVVFYAVNQREPAEKVSGFLKQKKLNPTVLLDRDAKVGKLYHVSGIPQTVIIGKSGNVEAVHVGFMPGMEKQLKSELEKLIAGETLIEPADEGAEEEEQEESDAAE